MITIKKILIIEDEAKISEMIKTYLEAENFKVFTVANGVEGLDRLQREEFDLVILDLMLPGISGIELCKKVRNMDSRKKRIPIIMLTAKSNEVDKLLGLELGADDYITKPFSLAELTARIKAVLRRMEPYEERDMEYVHEKIIAGELIVDFSAHQVELKGEVLTLTPTEFKLLATLIKFPGRVFSRLQLLEIALGDAYSGYERSIDTHMSNLRRKIEPDIHNPAYIITVFGTGYKFNPNITAKGSGD